MKAARQLSLEFTSTHTIIKLDAGHAEFTLDFFSPVSLTDYVRQSLPYSYLTVTAHPASNSHSTVEIFSGIDESWTAQNSSVKADFQTTGDAQMLILSGTASIPFTESNQMATYGDAVFASELNGDEGSLTCGSGTLSSLLSIFGATGSFVDTSTTFTPGNLVACAHNLGRLSSNASATFAVGLQRSEAIQYFDGSQTMTQTGYYRSMYKTVPEAVSHFLGDYRAALLESESLDRRVVDMGKKLSTNYADILEASVRQR